MDPFNIREYQDQVPPPQFDAEHVNKLQEFEWSSDCLFSATLLPLTITKVHLSGQKCITNQALHTLKEDYLVQIISNSSLAESKRTLSGWEPWQTGYAGFSGFSNRTPESRVKL
jgi:hypothetical protein